MKRTVVGGYAIALVLMANTPAFAAKTNYKADIEGGAVGSPGTGVGNFTFDDVTKRLCGKATYAGLTGGPVTVAALKEAAGFTIVKSLTVSDSPLLVDVILSDDAVPLLSTGPIYIAIGNATHDVAAGEDPNGEVNGELVVDANGVEQPCGDGPADAGVDSGAPVDAAAPAPSDAGDDASSPSVVEPPPAAPPAAADAAAPAPTDAVPSKKDEDGGCSTTGTSSSGAALLAMIGAVVIAIRQRRQR